MKSVALLVISLSLAACVEPGIEDRVTLPNDSHYVVLVAPYASPEECLANAEQIFTCTWSLSLCKNGRAGERLGDIEIEGSYTMIDSIAHISWHDGATTDFDVAAVAEVGNSNMHWIVDMAQRWHTLQFDNIDCDH